MFKFAGSKVLNLSNTKFWWHAQNVLQSYPHNSQNNAALYYLFLRFLNDFRDLDAERDRDCEPDLDEPELESDDDDDDDDEVRELELELLLLEVERLRRFRDLNISYSVYYPICTEYKKTNTTSISDKTE